MTVPESPPGTEERGFGVRHLTIDRLVGGRHADYAISEEMRADPRTGRTFVAVTWLLAAELVLGTAAMAVATVLHLGGEEIPWVVWMRLVVVLAMTMTLFYFVWRARRGFYWAYSRLWLFSRIFPVVALVTAAIPGLYPLWMITEQIVFSLILIGVARCLSTDHMREAFAKPSRAASPQGCQPIATGSHQQHDHPTGHRQSTS